MRVYFSQHLLQLFPSIGEIDRLPPGVVRGDVLLNPGTESLLSPHMVGDTNEFQLRRMTPLGQGHCSPVHTTRHSASQVRYVHTSGKHYVHTSLSAYVHVCMYVCTDICAYKNTYMHTHRHTQHEQKLKVSLS